ncbi:recombinase family protein [Candidatus Pacebacteria bacterium]|nr:recombinase family protein [Candidatus Paceibacterota bacterium]
MKNINYGPVGAVAQVEPLPVVKYCLYARKSMEDEERQALSIDSQLKEMRQIAEREGLYISAVRTEAHSAKLSGTRPVFNKIIDEIGSGRFNAILTWNADRLSRNAGDLGVLVDLMDNNKLLEIRTYNQKFINSPNEKFLLMILCSQAKLENDNKSINVKRGLRMKVEMGLWPCIAPTGYLNDMIRGNEGKVKVDPARAHVIKKMFELAAEGWSQRQIRFWLKDDLDFKTRTGKHLSMGSVQKILSTPFYYGEFEFPKGSGKWYKGAHKPIITKELFEVVKAQNQARRKQNYIFRKNIAFTKLMKCGLCGGNVTAEEKFKALKDGTIARYVYYGCTRSKDVNCKIKYIREEKLIEKLRELIDKISLDDLGLQGQFEREVERIHKFNCDVMGKPPVYSDEEQKEVDIKKYVKYLLAYGEIDEKRHILISLKNKLILKDGEVYLETIQDGEEVNSTI